MQSSTNINNLKKKNVKLYCFLRAWVVVIYIYIYIFSQTKTYFCYFNIAFEMSFIVVFLVFNALNI